MVELPYKVVFEEPLKQLQDIMTTDGMAAHLETTKWLEDNCDGQYSVVGSFEKIGFWCMIYGFEKLDDAILFRLRF